jgi:putative methionine-R-sulfoxide reductase with GAF domain
MDEKKQSTPTSDNIISSGKFWGTLALGILVGLVAGYFLQVTLQTPKTLITNISLGLYSLILIASLITIILTIRGYQRLGGQLGLYTVLAFGLVAISLTQGRALTASFSILVMSVIAILELLPNEGRRRYFTITGAAFALMWIIEWINPPWRAKSAAITIGPIVAIIFAIILIIVVAVQVWRTGNTLRNKLVVAFLGVTIIPLIIISSITYFANTTALTNDADQKLASAAHTTAGNFDDFINTNLEHVRAVAQFPAVVEYLAKPASQRAGSEQEARAIKQITTMARENPVFISSVALFDLNGIDLADTNPADIGMDKSNRNYVQETIKTGLPFASEVEYSATSGVPSIYFAAPAHDATGKVIGLIRIRYAATVLQKLIIADNGLVGATSYAVLFDSHHIRLAHGNNRDRVFKSIVPLDASLAADLQAKGLLKPGTPEENATNLVDFEAALNNLRQAPFFATDTDGDGKLEQTAIASLSTKDWSVAFIQDQNVYLAPITAQTFNNLLVAFILALVVGVAGFALSQTLAGPITRLTQTAEAIARGDINIQAKTETGDEIGKLAAAFNAMTAQLRELISSLEQRVAARTKDLATVAEVGTATSTILETDRLLQEVVDLTKERFNLYHSHIYLLDTGGENLILAAGAGEPGRQMVSEGRSIPLNREQSLVARAAREKKGVTVNDVTQSPDFMSNPLLPDTRSELAVPMLVAGNVIGVFDIQSDQVGRFTESDISIQTTLAAQLAASVQNVRQFEQSKAQADLETLVNTIGQKIQRTATVEETLQTAARELGLALGASRVKASIGENTHQGDSENASFN